MKKIMFLVTILSLILFTRCQKDKDISINKSVQSLQDEQYQFNDKNMVSDIAHYKYFGKQHDRILTKLPTHKDWPDFTSTSLMEAILEVNHDDINNYPSKYLIPPDLTCNADSCILNVVNEMVKRNQLSENLKKNLLTLLDITMNTDTTGYNNKHLYANLICDKLHLQNQKIYNDGSLNNKEKHFLLAASSIAEYSVKFWLNQGLKEEWLKFKGVDSTTIFIIKSQPSWILLDIVYSITRSRFAVDMVGFMWEQADCYNNSDYPNYICDQSAIYVGSYCSSAY